MAIFLYSDLCANHNGGVRAQQARLFSSGLEFQVASALFESSYSRRLTLAGFPESTRIFVATPVPRVSQPLSAWGSDSLVRPCQFPEQFQSAGIGHRTTGGRHDRA